MSLRRSTQLAATKNVDITNKTNPHIIQLKLDDENNLYKTLLSGL